MLAGAVAYSAYDWWSWMNRKSRASCLTPLSIQVNFQKDPGVPRMGSAFRSIRW